MTDNERYLQEARRLAKEFQSKRDAEYLREAYIALEGVILEEEFYPENRARLRTNCLALWLGFLQILDRFLDPEFNPEDIPENLVQPPPTSGGVVYPPGADPAVIDDPKARAEYEEAIAANRAKTEHYQLQIDLHRLNERIPPRVEAFIHDSYTSAPDDRAELRTAIDTIIKDRQRKENLLRLLTSPSP
jgi:hypothetical protein